MISKLQNCHLATIPPFARDEEHSGGNMTDLQILQLARAHLSAALEVLDDLGLLIPAANVDMALHSIKSELEQCERGQQLLSLESPDFSVLNTQAIHTRAASIKRTPSRCD